MSTFKWIDKIMNFFLLKGIKKYTKKEDKGNKKQTLKI